MKMSKELWDFMPNFKPAEFKCKCGCETECPDMDVLLMAMLQNARLKWGKPITVTSGHRCAKYNNSLLKKGAVKNSKHKKINGVVKATDFYIQDVTDTEKGRDEVAKWLKKQVGYSNCYYMHDGKYTWMGNCIHVEVK